MDASRPVHVLLVEDDPDDTLLVRTWLRESGQRFEIEHAERLETGLACLAAGGVDVLLVDLGLPDSNGLETLRKIESWTQDVAVIVLTGNDDDVLALEAVEHGAQDYLTKGEGGGRGLVRSIRYALERHQIRKALAASEERFRRLVDLSPDMISVVQEGRIVFANPAGLTLLGAKSVDDLIGRPLIEFVHPEGRERAIESMRQVIESQAFIDNLDLKLVRPDGTDVEVEAAALPTGNGDEPSLQLIVRDVTDRRRAERERQQLESQLRQAQKLEAVGQLAGGLAHDFNNLLTVIGGHGELLLEGLGENSPLSDSVEAIASAAGQASALTSQLLSFSRKQALKPKVLSPNSVVAEMEKMLRRLISENIQLVFHLDRDVGSVLADEAQLGQVLVNLTVNARDAMPDGGVLRVETKSVTLDDDSAARFEVDPGRYVVLAVSDSGTGMDAETCSRIFEPFFTTKAPGQGTGLGLASVYGFVAQSKGGITVYSEPSQGTTFRIYLPEVENAAEEGLPRKVQPSDVTHGSETILVVEDNDLVRALTCKALSTSGYRVIEASRPSEALELKGGLGDKIDLLLTDVVMPGMSGPDLAKRLLFEDPGLRVVYASGYTEGKLESETLDGQISTFLEKPFSPRELLAIVRAVLDTPVEQAPAA